MVWLLIMKSLYFFLPAYLGNMAPVLFRWLPFLNKPIHERYFGKNKTWRGIVVGILTSVFIFWLQKIVYKQGFTDLALIDYSDFSLALGFLLGMGVMLGDVVESYYKRRQKIPPGKSWAPWDQLDFVIGGILLSGFIYVPAAEVVLVLIIASPLLHVLINYLGYLLKIKKNRF